MPLNRSQPQPKGFSLVELLVTLAVFTLLMGAAVPSFRQIMVDSHQRSVYNALVGALHLARSEAIKRSTPMAVCARQSDNTCGAVWREGWLVFVDDGDTPGVREADELIEQVQPTIATNTEVTLTNRARLGTGVADPIARGFVRFGPRGTSNWRGGGTFVLCGTDRPVAVNLTMSGDLRKARKDAGELKDIFGETVSC